MNQITRYILLVVSVTAFFSCQKGDSGQKDNPTIAVNSVTLNIASKTLTIGETVILSATVLPENASNKKVTWNSSDPAVASVENGTVTGMKEGSVTIAVKTDDGGKTATCQVTVSQDVVHVTGVSLNESSISVKETETSTLTATVAPENASDKGVSWKSSDDGVATVNDGIVTGVKAGTATITVTTNDGEKTATCQVIVVETIIHVTGISLDKTTVELVESDKVVLKATIAPENATNKNVTWNSSNPEIISVVNGEITAGKEGNATIIVTTEDGGKVANCQVSVKTKVASGESENIGYEEWNH